MDKSLKESLKEGARVVVLAIIPVLVVSLQDAQEFDWRLIAVTAAVAFLRFIDSLLHEVNKELPVKERNDGLMGKTGLVGF